MTALAEGSRCLVTGGAGFIGSNLAKALLEGGAAVRVLDNLSTGNRQNLAEIAQDVEVVVGDIRDLDAVRAAAAGCDVVFHEAALTSVPRSVRDPLASHEVNASGTLNVLVAARDGDVGQVVYASSSSVYGEAERLPVEESMPTLPISPYGVSKLAGEHYMRAFHLAYGIATVSLRYFNVFGPYQDPESEYAAVVPRFITAAIEGRPVIIFGDGGQARDFTFVSDVVDANLRAGQAPKAAWGRTFNVACNDPHTVLELWDRIQQAVPGMSVAVEHADPRIGDIRNSHADITAARELLGFVPASTFGEGIRATAEWYVRHAR